MVGIPPALPPLLHLPPAFWSSQSLRGLCRSPSFPGQEGPLIIPRRKRADATPGLLHGTLRTQPCRRSSGLRSSQSPHLPHPLSVPQSPLVHPPLPRPELCPGVAGGAEAASAQRQGQVPANRLELGDSGGVSGPEGKDRNLSPRASPRNQHCAKHVHIHHLTQASQHICQPILQMKKLLEKIR